MKTSLMMAAMGLVALGVANTASASVSDYKFKSGGAFTANGSLTVTAAAVSLPCTASLTGTTAGAAKITAASFSGLSCLALTPTGLPWNMNATAPHGFTMKNVGVSAVVLGICGPGKVHAQLNAAGVILITGAGLPALLPCSVSANFTTSPKVEIIHKK